MQTINLNILSGAIPPVAHCSQGDVGRQIDFAITDDGADYAIPTGAVVWVEGTKYDKHGFAYDSTNQPTVVSYTGNVVTVLTTEQMTACAGKATCELKIVSGSTILYTLNFSLDVEPMALPSDSDMSKTDIPLIKQAIDAGDTAEISAKEAAASAKEAAASAKEAESAVTGVVSFNGRQGAVSPASGDYTPDMVGLNSIAPYKVATTPTASGTNAIAVGSNTKATGARSVGIGQSVTASGAEAVAIGTGASAANSDTVAVGHLATAKTSINGVAIGANAQATGKGSVAIGYGSKATEADTVSVGARRIVNVSTPTGDNDAANKAYVDSVDSAIGTRLSSAENSISTLNGKVTTNANNITSVQSDVSAIKTGLSEASSQEALNARVTSAENSISQLLASEMSTSIAPSILAFRSGWITDTIDTVSVNGFYLASSTASGFPTDFNDNGWLIAIGSGNMMLQMLMHLGDQDGIYLRSTWQGAATEHWSEWFKIS